MNDLSGIAAILRFPIPELDDIDEDEELEKEKQKDEERKLKQEEDSNSEDEGDEEQNQEDEEYKDPLQITVFLFLIYHLYFVLNLGDERCRFIGATSDRNGYRTECWGDSRSIFSGLDRRGKNESKGGS